MSGSANSNLGYGNTYPNSNVNGAFVNKDSSNYSGGFSSNEIPGCPGISGTKSNIDAAASRFPMKGGYEVKNIKKDHKAKRVVKGGAAKKHNSAKLNLQRKIKNITKQYKMKSSKKNTTKKIRLLKKRIQSSMSRALARSMGRSRSRGFAASGGKHRRSRSRSRGRRRMQRGGVYTQYMNNLPYTPNYSLGGQLSPNESALANPPTLHMNKGSCLDNYNHYTGTTFPSAGH